MPEKSENRYCVDCRFHKKDWVSVRYNTCAETANYIDLERNQKFASITRCGPEGKLWQPKKPSLWKRIFG